MCRLGDEERNPEDFHSASDVFTEWAHLDILVPTESSLDMQLAIVHKRSQRGPLSCDKGTGGVFDS